MGAQPAKKRLGKYIHSAVRKLNRYFPTSNNGSSLFFPYTPYIDEIEQEYKAANTTIPVYKNYRYSIKPGYLAYDDVFGLNQLYHKNRLSSDEKAFFQSLYNHRTLTQSLEQIHTFAQPIFHREKDAFIPSTIGKRPTAKLSDEDLKSEINSHTLQYKRMLSNFRQIGLKIPQPPARLLEIGFYRGTSPMGFEQLAYTTDAIDICYPGDQVLDTPAMFYKDHTKSDVNFHGKDITVNDLFENETHDIIFSLSVLEHIDKIPQAFEEMYRLLKPGGVMIHNYNPYYCPNGAHGKATGDAPWTHVRLSHEEYIKYLTKVRPYEADKAIDDLNHGLTRNWPIAKMQSAVLNAGFKIEYWREQLYDKKHEGYLTPEIAHECLTVNPGISLTDLLAKSVTMVARKL